jgi:hypothetical protein
MRNELSENLFVSSKDRLISSIPLRECPEHNVGLSLVQPISDLLDLLVSRTEAVGERTSRKELIAALILAAPSDGRKIASLLRRYRLASTGDTGVDSTGNEAPGPSMPRRPGPRPRSASQKIRFGRI